LASSLTGCGNVAYYAQAVGGHLEVMRAARPIGDVIRDPAGDPVLLGKLREVQAIREFASRELALPDNDSYRRYADIGRPFVVWNVFAAPEFSLEPKRWCMLFVGCVNYRGYYARADAERLATELRLEGYDAYVGGVAAYSTLGWFADPVLNTFLRHGTPEVARTVFHELAHQLVFVKGDSSFNESFATAVENEGLRRWTATPAAAAQREAVAAQRQRRTTFAALMQDYRMKFKSLYATAQAADQLRQSKAALLDALHRDFAALRASWGKFPGSDKPPAVEFNNARLVSYALYHELVPAFETLLEQEHHDLPSFYRRVASLADLDQEARHKALAALHPAAGANARAQACSSVEGTDNR
jgi:predicted aminopeptidase